MKTLSEFLEIEEGVEFKIGFSTYKIENNKLWLENNGEWIESIIELNDIIKHSITIETNQILTVSEKEYLKAVIKPFKNRVIAIRKGTCFGDEYISIELNCEGSVDLPFFKKDEHYKGMEIDMCYTLEKLGLEE